MAPEVAAAGTLSAAAAILVPLSWCWEAPFSAVPSLASVGALLVNALGATALGFVLYFRLLRSLGSVTTASVGYLKPTIGVLIGCTVMAEPVTWNVIVGLLATVAGVAAIVSGDFRKRPAAWLRGAIAVLRNVPGRASVPEA